VADLSVHIGSLELKNPVLVASGTFGFGDELKDVLPVSELGGIVTKGLTLKPREGNPPPRLKETPSGLLNSVGLENVGLEAFLRDKLPALSEIGTPIIVNVAGASVQEYEEMVDVLGETDGISALEINLSCPNVDRGGMAIGGDPSAVRDLTTSLRNRTSKPLLVKLTPNFCNILETSKAAQDGGADAVTLINTPLGTSIDVESRRYTLGNRFGGLSGPAIRPFALACVSKARESLEIPIVGVGGITDPNSALEFILAGATCIQIGTANFLDPRTAFQVIEGIREYLEEHGVSSILDLIGTAA
jgi:dihydroorotate dehydrogenase (NAD+) catalytic subunit